MMVWLGNRIRSQLKVPVFFQLGPVFFQLGSIDMGLNRFGLISLASEGSSRVVSRSGPRTKRSQCGYSCKSVRMWVDYVWQAVRRSHCALCAFGSIPQLIPTPTPTNLIHQHQQVNR